MPSTPKTPRMQRDPIMKTPKSVLKKTILSYDTNDSYVEEEDTTYIYNETTDSVLSEDEEEENDEEVEGIEEEDFDLDDTDVEIESEKNATKEDVLESLEQDVVEKQERSQLRQFLVEHEIPRKILHCSIGVITLGVYVYGGTQDQFIAPSVALFVIIFINDFIRLKNPELNKKIVENWWFLVRDSEVNSYNGTLWYLAGVLFVFTLAPKDIMLMSVLLLSWADTAASTFGRQFGKYTPKLASGKSLAGSLACFIVGTLCCYLFYGVLVPTYHDRVDQPGDILWMPESSILNLHAYALLTGLIGSLSEFIDLFNMDDNFTIPVVGGGMLYALVRACHV